jgi:transposase
VKTSKQAEQPERTDWREQRRLRVLDRYHDGWQQKTIAQALGISRGYVSQLVKRVKNLPQEHRPAALKIVKRAGRKPTFTSQHKRDIVALVDRGAAVFGLPGQVWTLRTLRQVIHKELGFWVGKSWLAEMLRAQGYSCQKPVTQAKERNDKAVAGFRGGWSNLKKGHNEAARA